MYEHFEYVSLTQLGKIFGVSGIEMGGILKKLDLRRWEDEQGYIPTNEADTEGLVKWVHPDGCKSGFYAWHREKTVAKLTDAGFTPSSQPEKLIARRARVTAKPNGDGTRFTIRADDGSLEAKVTNAENAMLIVNAINELQRQNRWK